jgi:hypothetical protein
MNFNRSVLFGVIFFSIFIFKPVDVFAAARYWVGGTNGANTNDTANWSASDPTSCTGGGASVPVAADTIIFDADCDNGATINANLTVYSININAGYSGTVSVDDGINVVFSSSYSQADGIFDGGTGNTTFGATGSSNFFTLSGGTLNLSSGITTFNNSTFTHTNGGTLNAPSGKVIFTTEYGRSATINVTTTETFNELEFSGGTLNAFTITSGDTLIANGDLILNTGYINTGSINAKANVTVNSGFGSATDGGDATINILDDGLGTSRDVIFNGGKAPKIVWNNPNATLNYNASTIFNGLNLQNYSGDINLGTKNLTVNGSFTMSNGTLDCGSGNFIVKNIFVMSQGIFNGGTGNTTFGATGSSNFFTLSGGTLNLSSGITTFNNSTFTHTNGGTLNAPSGKVIFTTEYGKGSTINVNVSEVFNDLQFSGGSLNPFLISSGDTLIANGDLILNTGYINTGSINAKANVTVNSGFGSATDGGDATINILDDGLGTSRDVIFNGGKAPKIVWNNPNATLNYNASTIFNGLNLQNYSGDINLGTKNLTVNGSFTMSNGTLDCGSGNFIVKNIFVMSQGIFNGGTGNTTFGATGSSNFFTLSGGTLNLSSGITTFNNSTFTHTNGGTLNAPSGKVIFTTEYGRSATINVTTTETFNELEFSGGTLNAFTITSGDTLIANGDLTLNTGVMNGGSINAKADVTVNSGWSGGGNCAFNFIGSSIQVLTSAIAGSFTTGQVTINNPGGIFELGTNAAISKLAVADGGTFDLNGYNFTAATSFTVANGGKLNLTGSETVTTPTLADGSTIEYAGADTLNIKDTWSYKNLTITGSSTVTAIFTADATTTVSGNTMINGNTGDYLILNSSIDGTQWKLNAATTTRLINYVNVKDSNNVSGETINVGEGVDSTNNTDWDISGIVTGNLTVATVGRHVKNIDFGTTESINLDGGFVFYRETGGDTVEEITISQLGTLEPEYINDVKLNYVINPGTSATDCPSTYDEVESFDENNPFGTLQDLDDVTGKATFSEGPGLEILDGNVLCIYPEYKIDFTDMSEYDSVGKTIKFGIEAATDIVLADEMEVTLSSTPLSVFGSTVLAQVGFSTITFVDKENNTKVFYVDNEEGVLYMLEEGEDPQRLTSRDVFVEHANFRDLTPVGSNIGQIEVTLRLRYKGPNYVGAPVVQTFKTTINSSY